MRLGRAPQGSFGLLVRIVELLTVSLARDLYVSQSGPGKSVIDRQAQFCRAV